MLERPPRGFARIHAIWVSRTRGISGATHYEVEYETTDGLARMEVPAKCVLEHGILDAFERDTLLRMQNRSPELI